MNAGFRRPGSSWTSAAGGCTCGGCVRAGRGVNAARDLQFELAARLWDEIADLKKELRGMDAAGLR
jgi:hypothetical protein